MPHWEPPREQVVEERHHRPRWPLLVILLAFLGIAAAAAYVLRMRANPVAELLAATAAVQSDVSGVGDSIQVVVTWRFTDGSGPGMADSVRVETGVGDGSTSTARVFPSGQHSDTLHLQVTPGAETIAGYSCVAAVYRSRLAPEACTPWQFVRPAAQKAEAPVRPDTSKRPMSHRSQPTVTRIVILPQGQQVDPDVDGRCAAWQRSHPGVPVWIDVNQQAVPECTGPNGKPTVAQFCAFAELSDGQRVTTRNSAGNRYCERLFDRWVQERVT